MYIPSDGAAENLDFQCVYTVEAFLPDLTKIIRLADPFLKKIRAWLALHSVRVHASSSHVVLQIHKALCLRLSKLYQIFKPSPGLYPLVVIIYCILVIASSCDSKYHKLCTSE